MPELAGRELPVRLRLTEVLGERDRAAQRVVHAGAAGQQRVVGRRAVLAALPDDLTARLLQPDRELDPLAHHRPHPLGERIVAGDLELVPDPHRHVGGVVALGRAVEGRAAFGQLRPRPVRPLGGAQPLVGGRAAPRSPQTLSAIAHSTWFHASTWPSGQPIAPSRCCTAAMLWPVARIWSAVRIPGTEGSHAARGRRSAGQAVRLPHAPPPAGRDGSARAPRRLAGATVVVGLSGRRRPA